jgi:hypothetical protein
VDNDGKNELVVVGDQAYNGAIYLVDMNTHKIKKTIVLDSGSPLYAVKIADIDGDGVNDIIAGGGKAHTGSPGIYIYVVNGATGAVKWHSQTLSSSNWNGVYGLDIADVDGNGNLDIVVSLDNLFIFDGVTHVNHASSAYNYTGITIKATKGQLTKQLIAGTQTGQLQFLAHDLSPLASYPVCSSAVGAVELFNQSEVLFTCANQLQLFDLKTKKVTWHSGTIANGLESDTGLLVSKIKGKVKVGLAAIFGRLLK